MKYKNLRLKLLNKKLQWYKKSLIFYSGIGCKEYVDFYNKNISLVLFKIKAI